MPAYNLVLRVARNTAYEEVAKVDSLVMHTRRDELSGAMHQNMQAEHESTDPGVFKVTRAVVLAQKEAEIKVTEARGIAEANRIIAGSLTREYLQHEANQALLKFAEGDNAATVIRPAGMNTALMFALFTFTGGLRGTLS